MFAVVKHVDCNGHLSGIAVPDSEFSLPFVTYFNDDEREKAKSFYEENRDSSKKIMSCITPVALFEVRHPFDFPTWEFFIKNFTHNKGDLIRFMYANEEFDKIAKRVLGEENQVEEYNSMVKLKERVQELQEALATESNLILYNILREAFEFKPGIVYEEYDSVWHVKTGKYITLKEDEISIIVGKDGDFKREALLEDVIDILYSSIHCGKLWAKPTNGGEHHEL